MTPSSPLDTDTPVRVEREGDVAVVVIDNPPVNAASARVRAALLDAVQAIDRDPTVQAAVLIGAGRTFIAGADIREFDGPIAEPSLPVVITAIEASTRPFVAAMHGAALGGGFELALGCDGRIAATGAVVGLPEVSLGIIPGAGGTQRLPRLVGTSAAIALVCGATRVPAEDALRRGMVDAVCDAANLRESAVALARAQAGRKRRLADEPVPAESADTIEAAAAAALRAGRHRPHVQAAIDAVRSAADTPMAEGLTSERATFQRLRVTTEASALRYLFFAERQAARVPGLGQVEAATVASVGVVGAGTMGTGIAMSVADAGLPCLLVDQDASGLERGLGRIREAYRRSVASGRLAADEADARVARIQGVTSLDALSGCDLVIEAVFEDMAVKTAVFRALDQIVRPDALLATNTSYLDVDALAGVTADPSRVLGLHFFAPANVMRLLEVVRGRATSPRALATALAVARRLGKLAIVAGVCEGFIGNRIYAAYRRQCEFMVEEGSWPHEIDAALERFGFAMGPFAVSDMSGLDIAWRMRQRLAPTRDPRARYCELPDRLCEMGRLGQKTGAGWYRYAEGDRKGHPDDAVRALILTHSEANGFARRTFSSDEIVARVLVTMTNEIAALMEDGIAARASDADLVLVNGYGFPRHEGGPVFWARRQDRAWLLAQLAGLRDTTGYGFRAGDVERLLDQRDE
jgi:3-hydroxyacyl-CoA dehydrogenase